MITDTIRPLLAKHSAEATPCSVASKGAQREGYQEKTKKQITTIGRRVPTMKPKNAADVGQFSVEVVACKRVDSIVNNN